MMPSNVAPQTVLTIYYRFKPDGFCKRYKLMIDAYLEKGWKVHYVAADIYPFDHPNLTAHILPTPMKSRTSLCFWIYFFALAPWALLWIGLKHRIDLISVGSPLYAFLSGLAKLFTRVPMLTFIFITPNSTARWKKQYRILMWIERYLETLGLAFSSILLANSWGGARRLGGTI